MVKQLDTKDAFDMALKDAKQSLVVIDFTATWCGPCQKIAPAFQALATEMPHVRFFKVDVDENEEAAEECGVRAMPTFQLFSGGACVEEVQGADMSALKRSLKRALKTHAGTDVGDESAAGRQLKKQKKSVSEDTSSEIERAAAAALAMMEAKKAREAKAEAKKSKPRSSEASDAAAAAEAAAASDAAAAAEAAVAEEKRLIAVCKEAKAAHLKQPTDEGRRDTYASAKQAYNDFMAHAKAVKEARRRRPQTAEAAEPSPGALDVSWTCNVCGVTLVGSFAKAQHLEGKNHRKRLSKVQDAATAAATDAAAGAAGNTDGQGDSDPQAVASTEASSNERSKGLFACALCACTLAASAQSVHEAGTRHQSKLRAVGRLVESGTMRAGDWVCVRHGPSLRHNFAAKTQCSDRGCDGTKALGISYVAACKMASPSWQATHSASDGPKGKKTSAARTGQQPDSQDSQGAAVATAHADAKGNAGAPSAAVVPVVATSKDIELQCVGCGADFAFDVRSQKVHAERGFGPPKKCIKCREDKKRKEAEKRKRSGPEI